MASTTLLCPWQHLLVTPAVLTEFCYGHDRVPGGITGPGRSEPQPTWGRGHNGLVNCVRVRTGMSKSVVNLP